MKYLFLAFVWVTASGNALALPREEGSGTIVYGKGWALSVSVPAGWDFDCCELAKGHGSNLLVFPKGSDGSYPDPAISLVVWDKSRTDVGADWDADATAYMAKFPTVKAALFSVEARKMQCRSGVYPGADQARDYVVFCDPGNDWDFRFGWSMFVHHVQADKTAETVFREIVAETIPMHLTIEKSPR